MPTSKVSLYTNVDLTSKQLAFVSGVDGASVSTTVEVSFSLKDLISFFA